MNSFDCVLVGEVFIDIIMQVKDNCEHFTRGGTSYCNFAKVELGGSGNVAVGLSAIGGTAAFVGKVGPDFFGELYLQDLKDKRIVTEIFRDNNLPTGFIMVLVENGERSFLVFRGANDNLSSNEIRKVSSIIEASEYLYFSGFSLVNDPQRSAVIAAINMAKKSKTKIIFDPGAFNLIKSEKRLFNRLLDSCDVFSPNLEEARSITGVVDTNDVVNRLAEKVPLTTLKCDKDGCIMITKNKIVKVSSYNVACVDPTGAGDAFTSGVIYGLSRELSLKSIGKIANWFAARVITSVGPRSFPRKSEIESFLKRLNDCDL